MTTLNRSQGNEYQNQSLCQPVQSRLKRDEVVSSVQGFRTVPNQESLGELLDHCISSLEVLESKTQGHLHRNLSVPKLIEHALLRGEGQLAANGAFCVETGKYTGRSPRDKFIVDEPGSRHEIDWNSINRPISEENFNRLYQNVLNYIEGRDLYVFDGYVGADPRHRFGVRVINEFAWQNLFVHQLFRRPTATELTEHKADFTVISVPDLRSNPRTDGLNSEAFIVVHLTKGIVLIGGTRYAGEMKKSIFSVLNYVMTKRHVLPMHCAANIDPNGHTALFFGLSGTGKTTLSADSSRHLIGDDEHGWSEHGIFNFEGGCYAKTIRLSQHHEPQIWSAIRFGALLENVVVDPIDGTLDFHNDRLTENTRAAYPLEFIPNYEPSGMGNHPKTILFLTADASGVLPPIAHLTREQAMYHFLSGYTSKLAGTERGVTEPQVTFSAGFGQVFFPLPPTIYAEMLGDRLLQHPETQVYLVNTGWSGGPYGVGQRISIQHTRTLVAAALSGELERANYTPHPVFKVWVPEAVSGVPSEILDPQRTWSDPTAYEQQAQELAIRFVENFKQFADVHPKITEAGPQMILT
jgi:phosphoenolpyruvate carboxykinase (ATP)